ncbi:hypothetical protein Hypma_003471 [Hypsizygus marmoreus]|uniref:HTH luxR-type domain-containing protein n=1 Tax=Hypsizygus marmoreus TaxID=39966 RepID=A0A369J8J2_HYPMA|nr:hypothetical protein Hypma_003471 [Hypsizygus marmoreus]
MPNTTPTKKSQIVMLKDLGHLNRDIAEKENIAPSTISCIYGRYRKTHCFYKKMLHFGHPHKLNEYDFWIGL